MTKDYRGYIIATEETITGLYYAVFYRMHGNRKRTESYATTRAARKKARRLIDAEKAKP